MIDRILGLAARIGSLVLDACDAIQMRRLECSNADLEALIRATRETSLADAEHIARAVQNARIEIEMERHEALLDAIETPADLTDYFWGEIQP